MQTKIICLLFEAPKFGACHVATYNIHGFFRGLVKNIPGGLQVNLRSQQLRSR